MAEPEFDGADIPDGAEMADLAEMENELSAALGSGPRSDLRGRVLAAVRAELRAGRRGVPASFLLGTAAAALLWVNLSMSLVNNTWQPAPPAEGNEAGLEEIAERMRKLMPDLPAEEARRQAASVLARTVLAPAGALPVPVYARTEPWDMR